MIRVFPFNRISGLSSKGGDITISWLIASVLIYSSNVISILFPSKLTDLFSGFDVSTRGGVLSLGPPAGAPIFAQAASMSKREKEIRIWKNLFNFDYL